MLDLLFVEICPWRLMGIPTGRHVDVQVTTLYLIGLLRNKGYNVKLLKTHSAIGVEESFDTLKLPDEAPRVIAFSAITETYNASVRMNDYLKAKYPHAVSIIGNVHANAMPVEALEHGFDYVFLKQSWETLLAFMKSPPQSRIIEGKGHSFPEDLDCVDLSIYDETTEPDVPVFSSAVGCNNKCSFCSVNWLYDNCYMWSAERTASVMLQFIERDKYKTREFILNEPNPLPTVESIFRLKKIWDILADKGYKDIKVQGANARTDILIGIHDKHPDMFRWLCETVDLFYVGVESIKGDTLSTIQKGVSSETAIRCIELFNKIGKPFVGHFMLGHPSDTYETVDRVMEFVDKHQPLFPTMSICVPYPGTTLYEQYSKQGRILDKNWDNYNSRRMVFKHDNLDMDTINGMVYDKIMPWVIEYFIKRDQYKVDFTQNWNKE